MSNFELLRKVTSAEFRHEHAIAEAAVIAISVALASGAIANIVIDDEVPQPPSVNQELEPKNP